MLRQKKKMKMKVMSLTLTILMIVGCWQPFLQTSLIKHKLYNIYTLFIICAMFTFTFTQFMDIMLNVNDPQSVMSTLYVMLSLCVGCYKIFNLWMDHESVAILIQKLTEGLFKPMVPDEIEVRRKFDRVIQTNKHTKLFFSMYALYYTVLIGITCVADLMISLLTGFRIRKLPYKEWIPYDYSSLMIFSITYIYQYISVFSCALISIGCDNLIVGLLLHLCCQITVLQCRLRRIENDETILRDCIRHHHEIIAYAYMVNKRFSKIIMFQFVTSTFIVCSNLYQFTRTTMDVNQIPLLCYTSCILTQIFIYCWFGNKVKVVSLQLVGTIFEMNWIMLNNNIKKSLLIIMTRAMIPIEFNSAYIINMNLESFVTLLKTSYSAYNLLIQV